MSNHDLSCPEGVSFKGDVYKSALRQGTEHESRRHYHSDTTKKKGTHYDLSKRSKRDGQWRSNPNINISRKPTSDSHEEKMSTESNRASESRKAYNLIQRDTTFEQKKITWSNISVDLVVHLAYMSLWKTCLSKKNVSTSARQKLPHKTLETRIEPCGL